MKNDPKEDEAETNKKDGGQLISNNLVDSNLIDLIFSKMEPNDANKALMFKLKNTFSRNKFKAEKLESETIKLQEVFMFLYVYSSLLSHFSHSLSIESFQGSFRVSKVTK